jgi:G6PDH family F420-dependent oxidoreductase
VRQAKLAEQAGFEGLWISDHYHPWLHEQGESGLVWSLIGAISQVTSLPITTAVTCPLMRLHPTIVAQAAATSAILTGGFTLGVGSGEAVNEHITGCNWPSAEQRLEMLEEAVEVIRKLLGGSLVSHQGPRYTVDTARLYSVPEVPPKIYMSGFGEDAIQSPCGPDPAAHAAAISAFSTAGFDEVYVGQVGDEQDAFFEAYAEQVLPRLRG